MQAKSVTGAAAIETRARAAVTPRGKLVRQAMLRAAQALLAEGATPSIAKVADRAGISRATAYRHFSTPEQLLNEAALDGIAAQISAVLKDGPIEAVTPEDAIEELALRVLAMVRENEHAFRTMLRIAVDHGEGSRGGRRLEWIRDALAPHADRLPPGVLDRLVPALALCMGIETVVVLSDVCGLDDSAAEDILRWMVRALVRQAFAGSKP